MVKRNIAVVICLTIWFNVAASASATSAEARKLMEFTSTNWEDDMSRLDYLDGVLRDAPDANAYIIVYGGQRGDRRGENQARIACIKNYMVERRGVSPQRIEVIDGGHREQATVELWLIPRGERGPEPKPTVKPKDVRFRKGSVKDWRHRCSI
jgi:hypothetical protein